MPPGPYGYRIGPRDVIVSRPDAFAALATLLDDMLAAVNAQTAAIQPPPRRQALGCQEKQYVQRFRTMHPTAKPESETPGRSMSFRPKADSLFIGNVLLVLLLVLCLAANAQARAVKIAVFPSNDSRKLQAAMDVLAAYLGEQTGDQVTALVTADYAELAQRLREGSVDIAWINTLNYVRIKEELPGVQYIATYMETNESTGKPTPFYQSYIVALRESGLQKLADIKGKRFAFTDTGSTSGYAYPAMLLGKNGIDPDRYCSKVFFLKRHDRVVAALLQGSVDAGAMSDGTYFEARRRHGDRFVILARSSPIPLDAVVAPETLPAAYVERYRRAFTAMPGDHFFCKKMHEILGWNAAGFATRDDAFYDSVREALHLQ